MPPVEHDPDYARGVRGPGPFVGKGAWENIGQIRRAGLALEKLLRSVLLDSEAKSGLLADLDRLLLAAEGLVCRYDRNGPPAAASELDDMEATLRTARKHPETFPPGFADELSAVIAKLRGVKKIGKAA
jgi:hypothetical protein